MSPVRRQAELEERILLALRSVRDPLLSGLMRAPDIVTQGLVSRVAVNESAKRVELSLTLSTAAYSARSELRRACEIAIADAVPWSIDIEMHSRLESDTVVTFEAAVPRPSRAVRQQARSSSGDGNSANDGGTIPIALRNIGAVVAISSCKGGVGKSTIATNLAWAIARRGGRVGLLDLDVYGPSLPTLLSAATKDAKSDEFEGAQRSKKMPVVQRSREHENMVLPVMCDGGVACMSFGWVNRHAGVAGAGGTEAAVLRGPVASRVASQLLLGTDWGKLDYLFLDMPPGTGDIQLTVAQHATLSGALVVTTPSMLSHVDVLKGVQMFEEVRVPTLAVVENLAYLPLPSGSEVLHPFGSPGRHLSELAAAIPSCQLEDLGMQLPVSDALNASSEAGRPLLLQHDCSATDDDKHLKEGSLESVGTQHRNGVQTVVHAFDALADTVIRRIYEEAHAASEAPLVFWDESQDRIVVRWTEYPSPSLSPGASNSGSDDSHSQSAAYQVLLEPEALRYVDATSGAPQSIKKEAAKRQGQVKPTNIEPRGNFAVRIEWDDGHEDAFFTYDAILVVAKRKQLHGS